jgi:predicted metal-binding membrane protein
MTVAGRPVLAPAPNRAAALTALSLTLGIAIASWVGAAGQMSGMDMGVATGLGSFRFFLILWMLMMAAMMLPGAVPAVLRRTHAGEPVSAVALFVLSYLAVWTLVGLAIYAVYRPHGALAAGVVVITAGGYELTPLKQRCRRLCREGPGSGFEYGLYCVGSSIGLMLILVVLSVMSIAWMAIVAALVVAQKLLPSRAGFDVSLTLAILGFGVLIILAPSSIPGLVAST